MQLVTKNEPQCCPVDPEACLPPGLKDDEGKVRRKWKYRTADFHLLEDLFQKLLHEELCKLSSAKPSSKQPQVRLSTDPRCCHRTFVSPVSDCMQRFTWI